MLTERMLLDHTARPPRNDLADFRGI